MAPKNAAIAVKKKQKAAAAAGEEKPAKQRKTGKAASAEKLAKHPANYLETRSRPGKDSSDKQDVQKPAKQRKGAKTASSDAEPKQQPAKRRASTQRSAAGQETDEQPAKQRKSMRKAAAGVEDSKAENIRKAGAGGKMEPKPIEVAEHTDYFLVKDEPHDYSIDDLEKEGTAEWDGVRNYQARNIMQKMRTGNQVLFYRSGTKDPGLVGLAEVCRDPYPDHTSWDDKSKAYDPKSTPDNPRWFMVDVQFKRKFEHFVSLDTLKRHRDAELEGLALFKFNRLSVMPVTKDQFDFMLQLAEDAKSA